MNELKAVVLEKKGSKLTILSSDGTFRHVHYKRQVEIGEEINVPGTRSILSWRIASSMIAVFLVVLLGLFSWNLMLPSTAVAMISVDINPSLQLTLDRKGRVLELNPLNSEGNLILSELSLQGELWEDALSQIIEKSVSLEYLNSEQTWVVVGYSPIDDEVNMEKTGMNTEDIAEKIDEVAEQRGVSPSVAVYELTPEEKGQAEEKGLSLGEYALVNTAQKAGVEVQPDEVKKADERVLLLERPEIKEQLKKDKSLIREALRTNFTSSANINAYDNKNVNNKDKVINGKNNKEYNFDKNFKERLIDESNKLKTNKEKDKNSRKGNEILKNRENQRYGNRKDIKGENEAKSQEPSRGSTIDRRKSSVERYSEYDQGKSKSQGSVKDKKDRKSPNENNRKRSINNYDYKNTESSGQI